MDLRFYNEVLQGFHIRFSFDFVAQLNPRRTAVPGGVAGGINFYWGAVPIGGAALGMRISYWGAALNNDIFSYLGPTVNSLLGLLTFGQGRLR